jgi:hypothetical protein
MDESRNPRHFDEGQPADTDSQAVEPRGRLGRRPPTGAYTRTEVSIDHPDTPNGAVKVSTDHTAAPTGHRQWKTASADEADGPGGDREQNGHDGPRPPDAPDGKGPHEPDETGASADRHGSGDAPGSGRSFLLSQAWWP